MNFPQRDDERWIEVFNLVKKYIKEHLTLPSATHQFKGEKVGQWYRNQTRLVDDGTIFPHRKEMLDELPAYIKSVGFDAFSAYVKRTGLLPHKKTVCGNQRLGKWLINIKDEYHRGVLETELIEKLNALTPDWMNDQTYMIGREWLDNVPFGDLPITLIYPDTGCFVYMEQGIYGCSQLYLYFEELKSKCIDENSPKYSNILKCQGEILDALFPDHMAQAYKLLQSIFVEHSQTDRITECFILQERLQRMKEKQKIKRTVTEEPSIDDIESAIGNIFADSKLFDFSDDTQDDTITDDSNYELTDDDFDVEFEDEPDEVEEKEPSIIKVSFDELLANPNDYIDKEIEFTEKLVTQSSKCNSVRKSIYCYKIVDNSFDPNQSIEIFFGDLTSVRKLIMVEFKWDQISVKGKVLKYSNSEDVYINATEILGLEAKLEAIEEPRAYARYVDFRQLIAFPRFYNNGTPVIQEAVILENNYETQTLTLCESTGENEADYTDRCGAAKAYLCYKDTPWAEKFSVLKVAHQKVSVRGKIIYNDKEKSVYIEPRIVRLTKDFGPESVSVKMLLAFPEKYIGKEVMIEELMVITGNNLKKKSFNTIQSTGKGKYEYITENKVEVFYELLPYVNKCIMLDQDYQKVRVYGHVRKYSNSNDVYIVATQITGDCLK